MASHIYTLLVILFGWTIFRFENLSELGTVLAGMFGVGTSGFANMALGTVFSRTFSSLYLQEWHVPIWARDSERQ